MAATEQWLLPGPSDPLQYVMPAMWGSTEMHDSFDLSKLVYWAWIDRISVIIGLRLLHLTTGLTETLGPTFVLLVNVSIVLLATLWAR